MRIRFGLILPQNKNVLFYKTDRFISEIFTLFGVSPHFYTTSIPRLYTKGPTEFLTEFYEPRGAPLRDGFLDHVKIVAYPQPERVGVRFIRLHITGT